MLFIFLLEVPFNSRHAEPRVPRWVLVHGSNSNHFRWICRHVRHPLKLENSITPLVMSWLFATCSPSGTTTHLRSGLPSPDDSDHRWLPRRCFSLRHAAVPGYVNIPGSLCWRHPSWPQPYRSLVLHVLRRALSSSNLALQPRACNNVRCHSDCRGALRRCDSDHMMLAILWPGQRSILVGVKSYIDEQSTAHRTYRSNPYT